MKKVILVLILIHLVTTNSFAAIQLKELWAIEIYEEYPRSFSINQMGNLGYLNDVSITILDQNGLTQLKQIKGKEGWNLQLSNDRMCISYSYSEEYYYDIYGNVYDLKGNLLWKNSWETVIFSPNGNYAVINSNMDNIFELYDKNGYLIMKDHNSNRLIEKFSKDDQYLFLAHDGIYQLSGTNINLVISEEDLESSVRDMVFLNNNHKIGALEEGTGKLKIYDSDFRLISIFEDLKISYIHEVNDLIIGIYSDSITIINPENFSIKEIHFEDRVNYHKVWAIHNDKYLVIQTWEVGKATYLNVVNLEGEKIARFSVKDEIRKDFIVNSNLNRVYILEQNLDYFTITSYEFVENNM